MGGNLSYGIVGFLIIVAGLVLIIFSALLYEISPIVTFLAIMGGGITVFGGVFVMTQGDRK